jgi:glutathione-specific gamma-glutamylcyclotransferase
MTAAVRSGGDVWVFAYGSLMWRPGFAYQEAVRARLHGWHRAYCVYSVHYRGTTERPGLVLGLARGGVCDGVAYRIGPEDAAGVHNYLRERELIYGVYREKHLAVALSDGSGLAVHALAYVADTTHVSFAGMLPLERAARIIRSGWGLRKTIWSACCIWRVVPRLRNPMRRGRGPSPCVRRGHVRAVRCGQ